MVDTVDMGECCSNTLRMNTVLAIVLLGAAYASAEAGYLRGGYGGYRYGGYGGYRGYGGYGYYGKRSAEADAEPGYLRGYGGYGYGRGYGYGGYGYGRGYYGKREAGAVAEADAEPGYLRGWRLWLWPWIWLWRLRIWTWILWKEGC